MAYKKVTKTLAEEVSVKLSKKAFDKKIQDVKKEQSEKLNFYVEEQIPEEVMDLFKREKRFFTAEGTKYIQAKGIYEHIYPSNNYPKNNDFSLTPIQNEVLIEYQKRIISLKREKKQLEKEIFSALISLGTYKRVESDFPEAFKLFPPIVPKSNLPALNLTPLRDKLK